MTVNPRTAHLIALVEGGATLEQAGRVYGIGRERVRQILKEQGVDTTRRPPQEGRTACPEPSRQERLGAHAERMWREGKGYGEVAEVLGVPRETVREVICERVPRAERVAVIANRYDGQVITTEQITAALRDAASVLGHAPSRAAYERLRAQGLIEGPNGGVISHRLGWTEACRVAGLLTRLQA